MMLMYIIVERESELIDYRLLCRFFRGNLIIRGRATGFFQFAGGGGITVLRLPFDGVLSEAFFAASIASYLGI